LLTGDPTSGWDTVGSVMLATSAVLLITLVLFVFSSLLERALGQTGINVITRILGMLLAALSVQFVVDGLRDLGVLA